MQLNRNGAPYPGIGVKEAIFVNLPKIGKNPKMVWSGPIVSPHEVGFASDSPLGACGEAAQKATQ